MVATRQPTGRIEENGVQRRIIHARKQRLKRPLLPQRADRRPIAASLGPQKQRTFSAGHYGIGFDVSNVGDRSGLLVSQLRPVVPNIQAV